MGVTNREAGATAVNVLASTQVTRMLPVKDIARARRFYEQAHGLAPRGARPDGKFVYYCGGTELALFPKPEGTKAEHTAISFKVADIAVAILEPRFPFQLGQHLGRDLEVGAICCNDDHGDSFPPIRARAWIEVAPIAASDAVAR
jgi:catechol 2,3-dioxygenase-like lactoylglutathione lyase family enzyme